MEKSVRNRNQLPGNLPQLQNLIKRDSSSYRDEFLQQHQHYRALMKLFLLNPSQESKKLEELVMFLSQICNCYKEDMKSFPEDLISLLQKHGPVLEPEIRLTLCRGLILMRNRDFVHPKKILELFFQLFRCQDKILRKALYIHIVSDLKSLNTKRKNNEVNRSLQSFMYTMLNDSSSTAAKMSLEVIVQLYKKNIWNDAKTVNVLAAACFSNVTKIVVCTLKFFLTDKDGDEGDDDDESGDDSEDEATAMRKYIVSKQTFRKGKKRERKMAKAVATIKKKQKKKGPGRLQAAVFSALHLINDPQDFAEKLFNKLEKSKDKFEVRLMMMSLISRLIGLHELFLLNYYPFLQRYLLPHQEEVTKVLTYLAQASHPLIPPEVLEPSLRAVVNNFVSERNSTEVMSVGLNTVREICVRCPLAMSVDMLRDVTSFKSHKGKSVMMASRSIIHLYRDINPDMLHRKDRGKPTEFSGNLAVKDYGELDSATTVPGAELIDLPIKEPLPSEGGRVREEREGGGSGEEEEEDREWKEDEWEEGEEEGSEEDEGEWVSLGDSAGEEEDDEKQGYTEDREGEEGLKVRFSLPSNRCSARRDKRKIDDGEDEATLLLQNEIEEEEKLPKEVLELLKTRRKEEADVVASTRFLTQEEFSKIRLKQMASKIVPQKGRKRHLAELLEEQEARREEKGELLSENAIHMVDHAKRRHEKDDRISSIMEGRGDREKFGSKRRKLNPDSSTTNKQKSKMKSFVMIKHTRTVRGKNKKSFREKQMALRQSLLKQRRNKK